MITAPSLAVLVDGIRDARFVAGGRAPGALDCAGAALLVLARLGRPLPPDALPAPGEAAGALLEALAAGGPLGGSGWRVRALGSLESLEPGDLLLSDAEGPHLATVVRGGPQAMAVTVTRRQGGLLLLASRVPAVRGRYRVESEQKKIRESAVELPPPIPVSAGAPSGFLFDPGRAQEDPA